MTSAEFEIAIAASTALEDVCLSGDLELTDDLAVSDIILLNSRVTGDIVASGTVFAGRLDLRGTTIEGNVEIDDVLFSEDVIFRNSTFVGDFSAVGTQFRRLADLRATFAGAVDATGALFFGRVIATRMELSGPGTFDSTFFASDALFRLARFSDTVSFEGAIFVADADFRDAVFVSGANFRFVTAGGLLSFRNAIFAGGVLHLDNVAADELDLGQAELSTVSVLFADTTLPLVRMDVSDARAFSRVGDRKHVLLLLSRSASADGDLSTANSAQFELNALRARDQHLVLKVPTVIVGEWMAGYLVRPAHPGAVLALLFAAAFLARVAVGWRHPRADQSYRQVAWVSLGSAWTTLSPRSWPPAPETPAALVGWAASALATGFLILLVISLANSVPVTKELIDAAIP